VIVPALGIEKAKLDKVPEELVRSILEPRIVSEMIDFDKTIVMCLGLGNLTAEDMVEQCLKYDTKESWTYGLSREYLLKHAMDWYNCNEMLKRECPKYNIRYIDTSKNRFEIFDEILKEI